MLYIEVKMVASGVCGKVEKTSFNFHSFLPLFASFLLTWRYLMKNKVDIHHPQVVFTMI